MNVGWFNSSGYGASSSSDSGPCCSFSGCSTEKCAQTPAGTVIDEIGAMAGTGVLAFKVFMVVDTARAGPGSA